MSVVWIVQILLAVMFVMAGTMKVMRPKAQLADKMGWVDDFSDQQVKGIGILEILGGVGLILPAALNILPILTGVAAVGLALTMVGAAITHIRRQEYPFIVMNVVLFLLAGFVAFSYLGI